jgi:nuclear transcription Y subunit beta
MESSGWTNSMMPGDKVEPGTQVSEYPSAEGSNSVEGGTDPNYMYGSQAGHNGAAGADGY